jgi:hypothetical protein
MGKRYYHILMTPLPNYPTQDERRHFFGAIDADRALFGRRGELLEAPTPRFI